MKRVAHRTYAKLSATNLEKADSVEVRPDLGLIQALDDCT